MKSTTQYRKIGEHSERIGNTTFIVRSFDNPDSNETAEQLLLKLMESKIKSTQNESEVQIA